jgi:hypothetical protein
MRTLWIIGRRGAESFPDHFYVLIIQMHFIVDKREHMTVTACIEFTNI